MLSEYISKGLSKVHYEIIEDKEPYYGEIPELQGIWATGTTLEECRQNLIDVLEGWILVRVRKGLPIPELDKVTISIPEELKVLE
ncbi:MAG TPA: type II toxin-antitoxin system HicB family antitoxin [Candidatus Deferrimicrobium sp.]|nr:type II toxin-antitoxin system HicB family antitoxin [Candidatus Deferrimicrobium sp.]